MSAYTVAESGQPPKKVTSDLDTNGSVAGLPDVAFLIAAGIGRRSWRRRPQCQECMVKQYFRYVSGRMETPADYPVIKRVTADFRDSQFRFQELIVSLSSCRRIRRPKRARNMSHVITKRRRISRRKLLKGLTAAGTGVLGRLPPLVAMFNSDGHRLCGGAHGRGQSGGSAHREPLRAVV